MSQLSRYIQKQLKTILQKIQQTPPRRCSSLQKIKTLVNRAPITHDEKNNINESIKKIQSAMLQSNKTKVKDIKTKYAKNLFYENMFLEEKNINTIHKQVDERVKKDEEIQYNSLLERLQSLRNTRLKREQYLNQLVLKTQRMQRLVNLKQQNQQKYLKSKRIEQESQNKKIVQQSVKKQLTKAIKNNKIKSVSLIVSKYRDLIK